MSKEASDYLELQKRVATFKYPKACVVWPRPRRTFAIPRASFYLWKRAYDAEGEARLVRKKPVASRQPRGILQETEDKVLELCTGYHLGLNASFGTWTDTAESGSPSQVFTGF